MTTLKNKNILLVISGGIAAYKSLELIRLIKKNGGNVRCILTNGGAQFITPLSVASLSEQEVYTDLFSLKDETEMGHIRLSREADLIVVAPASANTLAKLAWGLADDLASTTLLAANKPILIAPAMNQQMWASEATKENLETLKKRGVLQVGPSSGEMACGETGLGRMSEPEEILSAIEKSFGAAPATLAPAQKKTDYLKQTLESEKELSGLTAIVTAGPTYEPIDPVRFIGNRSSGKQGYAIAQTLAASGVNVTLISGPTNLPAPANVKFIRVETAAEMLKASEQSLPADIGIFTAAVADWSPEKISNQKIKKSGAAPNIALKENPDTLKTIANHKQRPKLVIGFAAETENLLTNAKEKLAKKNCDWILANDVSKGIFGEDETHIHLITPKTTEDWKKQSKQAVATFLADKIMVYFQRDKGQIGVI